MLDAYIIESIRRQERTRQERDRIWLELPLEAPSEAPERSDEDRPARDDEHVIIIPLYDPEEEEDQEAA